MKIFTVLNQIRLGFILFLFISNSLRSQIPTCPDTCVYLSAGSSIYRFCPNLPVTVSNPSVYIVSGGGSGLSLNNNLNSAGPSPTFYSVIGGNYSWWNGSTWVGTTHSTGNAAAVNPGGGGCYIYNMLGGTGQIFRYDGTGPGTLLTTITSFSAGGPYDVAADIDGNFYVLRTQVPGQYMNVYNSAGTFLNSYTLTGMPGVSAGGGFVVSDNKVYVFNINGYFRGVITGTTIAFTNVAPASSFPSISDVAACSWMNTHSFGNSGALSCSGGSVTLQATGWSAGTTYSWSGPGLSGPATNSTALATSAGVYTCTIMAPGTCTTILTTSVAASGSGTLAVAINPTNPTICLGGSVTLTASGATNYTWTPSSSLSSATGSAVVASPSSSTVYSVIASSGSCAATPQSVIVSVSLCMGINGMNESSPTINLFPNPNNGSLVVKGNAEMNLSVRDELGRVVRYLVLNSSSNYETQVSNLPSGVYFLQDQRTGKTLNTKIVVIAN